MENAVDALKIAFAMFVFVLAIGIAFTVFSQARYVADIVLFYTDKTNFEQYVPNAGNIYREVGIETVIPSIRRYVNNNEGYSVKILSSTGTVLYTFDLLEDQEHNLTPTQTEEQLEKNLEDIIKKYKKNTFIERFSAVIYRGHKDEETGFEALNTDEKVEITYQIK